MNTRTRAALFAAVAVGLVGVTGLLATRGSGSGRFEIVDTNDAPDAVAARDPPTIEHFRDGFPDNWTVNEVLGPVEYGTGVSRWTIDVDGDASTGVVDVWSGMDGPDGNAVVGIFFAAK